MRATDKPISAIIRTNFVNVNVPNDHDSDLAECEAKATVSSIKEFATTTRTLNHPINAHYSQLHDYDNLVLLPVRKLSKEPEGRLTLVHGPRLP